MTSKIKKKIFKADQSSQYKNKCLIITLSDFIIAIDSMNVRDKINKALEIKEITKAIISIVQKSISEASIVITIIIDYTAKDLL